MGEPPNENTYYTIRVSRTDVVGKPAASFEFGGYGILRELLDDIEDEAQKRGWFEVAPDGE